MLLLQVKNLTKYYGAEEIFSGLSLSIESGEKIGLVGPNGAGKTTFLKCLTGQEIVDQGEITLAEDAKLGYLEQLTDWQEQRFLMQEMLIIFADLVEIKEQMTSLEEQMGEPGKSSQELEKLMNRYSRLTQRYEEAGGYQYENKIKRVAKGLGFNDIDFQVDIRNFSGGQKTRLNLAKLLVREPEMLILDEPTNHLDIEAIEWLEQYLQDYKGTLLIVSHDRFFLDKIVGKVIELESGRLNTFRGNYSRYLLLKEEQQSVLRDAYLKQQKEIKKTEDYINRYRAGIKAKQARGRQSILNRLERLEAPKQSTAIKKIQFAEITRSGERVLAVCDLEQKFMEKQVFKGMNFTLTRGEKVGLVGANGTGKSTILKIIAGELEATAGEVSLGSQVRLGYFAQEYESLMKDNQVIQELTRNYPLGEEEARSLLARFLFLGDDVYKAVKSLSGGERGRLALLKILLSKPNLLLLDEPTNHLDIPSKEAIEKALVNYEGTILVVSHDRYFLDQVVDRVLELKDGQLENFLGNYSYYKEVKDRREQELVSTLNHNRKEKTKNSLVDKEKQKTNKQLKLIEGEIGSLEGQIAELNNQLTLPEVYSDGIKSKGILEEIRILEERLTAKYQEWEQLVG